MPMLVPIYLFSFNLFYAHCLCSDSDCTVVPCPVSESSNYKLGRLDKRNLLRTHSLTHSQTHGLTDTTSRAPGSASSAGAKNRQDKNSAVIARLMRHYSWFDQFLSEDEILFEIFDFFFHCWLVDWWIGLIQDSPCPMLKNRMAWYLSPLWTFFCAPGNWLVIWLKDLVKNKMEIWNMWEC